MYRYLGFLCHSWLPSGLFNDVNIGQVIGLRRLAVLHQSREGCLWNELWCIKP